jgi:hypothetical protein
MVAGCLGRTPDNVSDQTTSSARARELCEPPTDSAPPALTAAQVDALAGRYALTVVGTQGVSGDSVARGTLELWRADSAQAHNPWRAEDGRAFPLAGASDIDLKRIAPVSLAYSPATRDRDRPGVQVHRDGSMWFGNAFGRVFTLDAGVVFTHLQLDGRGFRGEWQEGGLRMVNGAIPAGYFCAVRLVG